jgi:hypothetical protein
MKGKNFRLPRMYGHGVFPEHPGTSLVQNLSHVMCFIACLIQHFKNKITRNRSKEAEVGW